MSCIHLMQTVVVILMAFLIPPTHIHICHSYTSVNPHPSGSVLTVTCILSLSPHSIPSQILLPPLTPPLRCSWSTAPPQIPPM